MVHLSKKITTILLRKNIITKDDREIYEYGFELLIASLIGYALVLITSFLLGMFWQGVLFLAEFVVIRNYTGGYHADSHLKCNALLIATVLFVLTISKIPIPYLYLILMYLSYLVTVVIYAPLENKNKPLNLTKSKKYKKISIALSLIVGIIATTLSTINITFTKVVILTIFVVTLLILVAEAMNFKE